MATPFSQSRGFKDVESRVTAFARASRRKKLKKLTQQRFKEIGSLSPDKDVKVMDLDFFYR